MPGWIGPWELLILLVVVLLIFGPKKLPEAGRSLGKGLREFKNSVTGKDEQYGESDGVAELTVAAEEERVSASARERDSLG